MILRWRLQVSLTEVSVPARSRIASLTSPVSAIAAAVLAEVAVTKIYSGGCMEHKYCGACRGERGCKDCKMTVRAAKYECLTEFSATGFFEGNSLEHSFVPGTDDSGERSVFAPKALFLAADLGTTTLGFVCTDEYGEVIASYGTENPQRFASADVIGRIDAACHGAAEQLKQQIREALAKGFLFVLEKGKEVLRESGYMQQEMPVRIALAGNTTMQHLLLGYSVEGMAKAPFIPYSVKEENVSFSELLSGTSVFGQFPDMVKNTKVFVFPGLSAFVGGDAEAGAYGLSFPGIDRGTQREDGIYLLADLGTNGELLLSAHGKIYATAAAMGSAFEGGRFAYASDLFASDETGLLCEPHFTEGFFVLDQEDIRTFQLAKGAIRAGIELLCKRAGILLKQVDTVFLAGGAGRYCRADDLLQTGILPRVFEGKIKIVGNSCIGGLLYYLKNPANMLQCNGKVLNLAEEPEFEDLYYRFMEFKDE